MDQPRWWKADEGSTHEHVTAIADWLWNDQSAYRDRCLNSLSLYEGRRLPGLSATAYLNSGELCGDDFDFYWNVPRSLVQTVTAKIAGRQKPKPSLVCSDADWQTKRRAKKLEKFCEAQLHQPQGSYRDAWALGVRVFLDAAVFGFGCINVFADDEAERVALERVLPWEILVDPLEAECGEPLNFFRRYHYDKDSLASRFPGKEEIIDSAPDTEKDNWSRGRRAVRSTLVYEAYRLPTGKTPGLHVICTKKGILAKREWTRKEPPLVFLRWSPELLGFGGTSLVEEAEKISDEVNFTLERMREAEHLCSNAIIVAEDGAVTNEEALNSNEIGVKIFHKAGSAKPEVIVPDAYSQSTLNWLKMNYDKGFELTGVSQMSAGSKKEPGVTAGIALRTIADMETERFSVVYAAYEQMMAVDLSRHMLAETAALSERKGDVALRWPGKKFLQMFSWTDVALDEELYFIQPEAVSGIANTPADRLQLGQDLYNSGIIGKDSFLRVIQYKDTDSEIERQNTQYSVIEKYIESWLDATPETLESGEFKYRAPIPFMDHAAALVQTAQAYMVAELEGAPDWNLEFFLRFMKQCDQQIQKIAAKQAQAAQGIPPGAQPPAMPPPPPPAPGMPAPGPMVH